MTEPKLDSKLRNRISRFIHTGIEIPKYYPGCWSTHKYFEADKFPAAQEIIQANPNSGLEVVKIIVQAAKDGWYTRFESIAFALAQCLKLGPNPVKEAVYNAALEICESPEQMMLFNRQTRILKTGNGQGWCKSVREWYLHKDPMELAKEIGRVRARFGRSHNTLIRKSHIKIEAGDHARDAVVKYVIFGLKRARQLLADKQGTKEIFDYLQKVEDLRHCEDPVAAAAIAAQNQFTLDHVPGHLLTSQDVWDAVLPQMSLRDVLSNIQRIHNMGFLTNDSTTTAIIVSMINNQEFINKSEITPIEVYIILNNYKLKTKPQKAQKAKIAHEKEERRRLRQIFDPKTGLWEWSSTKRHPKEIKNWGIEKPPSQAIIASLNKLIDQSWLVSKPTKVRYLITMDMRHHMFKGRHFCKRYAVPKRGKKGTTTPASAPAPVAPTAGGDAEPKKESKKHLQAECFYNCAVTPGHVAIILALQLLKREKDVKLAVFTEEGIQMVTLERNFTNIEEAEFQLRKMNLGRVQLDAPIEWASKNKQKFDVFINMIDRATRYMELDHAARGGRGNGGRFGPPPVAKKNVMLPDHCPVRALERYRKDVGDNTAKLIVMNLASHRVSTTDGSHEGVLDIVGIDEFVPKVMDAFALGQFK